MGTSPLGADGRLGCGRPGRRLGPHLGRRDGVADLGAVRRGDAGRADQVGAGLRQRAAEVGVVARRGEHRGLDLVVDAGGLVGAQARHRAAVEGAAVGDQEGGLVVHAAVRVDAARVGLGGVRGVVGARHAIRIAVRARGLHVADRPDARDVLAELPLHLRRVVARAVGLVDQLAEDIGERFVDRARLVVVEEVGAEVGDAVSQLVPDDVVRRRVALAVDHLLAVPERVLDTGTSARDRSTGRST